MTEKISREYVTTAVYNMIREHYGIEEASFSVSMNLKDDLGADSLDVVEMIMTLEDRFEVRIPDKQVQSLQTVKDIIDVFCDTLHVDDEAPAS